MSPNLVEQRLVLERELARLEELLALDQNWRRLTLLERVSMDAHSVSGMQGMHLEQKRLRAALAENRIYCARERILEAIRLIQDEATQTSHLSGYQSYETYQRLTVNDEYQRWRSFPHQTNGAYGEPQNAGILDGNGVDDNGERTGKADAHHLASLSTFDGPPDPLTKIRGIDAQLETELNALGVTQFRQIANWTHNDVRHIALSLKLDRRISRENWIEQAAMLSGCTANDTLSRCRREERHSKAQKCLGPALDKMISKAARSIVSQAKKISESSEGRVPPRDADGIKKSKFSGDHFSPDTASSVAKDRLQDIGGIDDVIAQRLNAAGVSTFAQIANWSAKDVAKFNEDLALGRRIQRAGWIEQAALLAGNQNAQRRSRGDGHRISAQDWSRPVDPNKLRSIPQHPIAVQAQTHCRRPAHVIIAAPPPNPVFSGAGPEALPDDIMTVPDEVRVAPDPEPTKPPPPKPIKPPPLPAWAVSSTSDDGEEEDTGGSGGKNGAQADLEEPPPLSLEPDILYERYIDGLEQDAHVRHFDEHSLTPAAHHPAAVYEEGQPMGVGDSNPAHRSLRAKLKRAKREPVDGEHYAAYRGHIREASVEIVKPMSEEMAKHDGGSEEDFTQDHPETLDPNEQSSWGPCRAQTFAEPGAAVNF